MALSPDRLTVAVYNMSHGVDIWDIWKAERRQSCKMPKARRNFPLPVTFLHDGSAVAAGHMEGRAGLWSVKDGSLIEELDHAGRRFADLSPPDLSKQSLKRIRRASACNLCRYYIFVWSSLT